MLLLELLQLFVSCILRLLHGSILGFGSLADLDISLLLNLIELSYVHLGGDRQVNLHFLDRVFVVKELIVYDALLFILINCVQKQTNLILLKVYVIDEVG